MKRLACAIGVMAMGLAGMARAESGLHTRDDRPYIVEVGDPTWIDDNRLQMEMRRNEDLRNYVQDYGYPDAMEIQRIVPNDPWADYEVRIYYLDNDRAIAFGNALFALAPEVMDFGIVKFNGPIRPEDRERIAMRATAQPQGDSDALTRVLYAADRAAAAAESAEAASQAAMESADRAARITDKMEAGFNRSLHKK